MSITESLIAYTCAAVLLTLTPGLDTALVLRTATLEGRKQAFHTLLGINLGCLLWGIAVACGLGVLVAVSQVAYGILKYCGAAWLCWLGVGMLLRPRTSLTDSDLPTEKHPNWLLRGLTGNLLNPKVGIFYLSFLPQFIPQGHSLFLWTLGLVGIHMCLGLTWLTMVIAATHKFSRLFKHPKIVSVMDRLTGLVLLSFAARLALSKR